MFDQSEATLITKLFAPPPPRLAVPRPRLHLQLERALEYPLTLITAPAGYGKTSLVTTWLQEVGERREVAYASAWLSLDSRDNDEVRFWRYVISALDRAHPSLEERLSAYLESPRFAYEHFLTALINHLSAADTLVFVLDDYHLIENRRIHAGVAFWLEHLPPPFHLVMTSRREPPLPLAKMRVKQRLLEFTVDDLRFSKEEVESFLSDVMNLDLSRDEVAALERSTEGWAASLHLAALSLQGAKGARSSIGTPMRTNRFVFDYFADEVFSHQPSDIQAFLLHISLLERFSAELCASLTESTPEVARSRVAKLEAANLFVVPLDADDTWFRFHPLFAEFLQRRLKGTAPERVPDLYLRAAEWCEAHGSTGEAIRYVLAGGDTEGAVALVERHDRTLLWQRDGRAALRPWLAALPEDVIRARARLCLDHAWLLLGTSDGLLDQRLSDLARLLKEEINSDKDSGKVNLHGELAIIRAERATEHGDYTQALTLLNRALELLTDPLLRGVALQSKGYLLRTKGNLTEAEEVLQEAEKLCGDTGNFILRTFALSDLGEVYKTRGRLHDAARTFHKALTPSSSKRAPAESGALIGLADVLREQNQPDEAEAHVRAGLELAERAQFGNVQAYGEVVLARILEAKGDTGGALTLLEDASNRATQNRRAATFDLYRALLHVRRGDTAPARSLLGRMGRSAAGLKGLVYARLLFAEAQFSAAHPLLAKLVERAEASGRVGRLIAALVLQARVLESQHQTDDAVTTLTRALNLAQPEGFVRVFLDEGESLRTPLQRAVLAGGAAYATTLLSTFPPDESTDAADDTSAHLLTKREQQVLELIAEGLSNDAIAETLIRSTGTVKSHTSSIYGKLGVRGRTEAVARARGLGLLE